MLARTNRLTRGSDYRNVVRRGVRCAGSHSVVYVIATGEDRDPRFGFIVSKQVGTAVVRNTVRRRMKAACAAALPAVRRGADIVIRALPPASEADYAMLAREIDRCVARSAS